MTNSTASRVTIKNLKTMSSLSEETLCFTATVYVDGKKFAQASNRGHGGCTDFSPVRGGPDFSKIRAVEVEFGKALPPMVLDGKEYPNSLENVVDELTCKMFDEQEQMKLVRRELNKFVLVEDKATGTLKCWTRKHKGADITDRIFAHVEAKYPGFAVLNKLPISESMAIYAASN
jgi:hypothetical protein